MKIKLLMSRGGPGLNQEAGEVIEVGEAEGVRMIEAGQAIPVRQEKRETATKKTVSEKTVKH